MSAVMNAARAVLADFRGRAQLLAAMVNKNDRTLAHEVAGVPGTKLGLETAVEMTRAARDLRILNAFATECGCAVIPIQPSDPGAPLAHSMAAFAQASGALQSALACADSKRGSPSANDVRAVDDAFGRVVSIAQQMAANVRHEYALTRTPTLAQS